MLGLGWGFGAACRDRGPHCLPRPAPQMPGLPPAQTCPGSSWGPSFSGALSHLPCSSPGLSPTLPPPAQPHPPLMSCPTASRVHGALRSPVPATSVGRRAHSPKVSGHARGWRHFGSSAVTPGRAHSCQAPDQGKAATSCWGPSGRPEGPVSCRPWPCVHPWVRKEPELLLPLKFEAFQGSLVLHDRRQPVRREWGQVPCSRRAQRQLAASPQMRLLSDIGLRDVAS